MQFNKLSSKAIILTLAGIASSMAAGIAPLTFGNTSTDADNWNYLSNFKLWGTSGITFGDRPEFYDLRYYNHRTNENDYSGYNDIDPYTLGWVGTAKGNMVTGEKGWIDGPVIVGGSITRSGNKMLLVTGPVRTAGSVDVTYRGSMCQGNNQSGACANIPEIRPNLSVPTLSVNLSKERSFSVSGKEVLRITDFCSGNDVCDIYFNSINFMNDSRLVIQMPAGGVPTRIFANRLTFGVHPEIVVNYDNKDLSQKEYEGNLLIYSNDDIDFTYAENHPIMGTFISTKKIILARDALFAGQLIANEVVVGNESHAENFVFKPFKILPNLTLSSKAATFEENDTWQTIKIGLDKEIENDVTFKYCFKFNSQAVAGLYASKDDVAAADASHDFPVCGDGSPATATIPKGKIYPSKDIYIKPLIDGLIENSSTGGEKLWLVISDITGARLSTDNYDDANSGFNIFITDVNKQPGVTKELVVNVNEDEKHTFIASEFNFQHESQSFASIIITGLPTAGTLTYNGTAVTKGLEVTVENLNKLTYQAATNDFGNSYATFKYKVVGNATEQNTSAEYTATVNVLPVNDKPSVSDVTFIVGEQSHTISGGPIEVNDVSNERNKDSYTYTLVNVKGSDYTAFNSTFEIVKLNDQNATIKVKNSATLDYSQKSEYVVYATVTDNASTETSTIAGPLTSAQFKITVKISDEPETITQESKILPLTFGSGNGAEENDNWNYLVNYKMWGQTGVSFGNSATFINEAGWIGTTNDDLTFGNDGRIAGAVIVGGSIMSNNHTRLTTGPVRYGGTISSQLEINDTKCQGTTTAGDCADVPQYRKLIVPKISSWPSNMPSLNVGNTIIIDATTQSDFYYSSITLANDSKLIVRMPAGGRPTRIFTRSLTLNAHPQILVQYDNEANPRCIAKSSTFPCNGEYEGNLLIYVENDISFRNADYSPIDGTIISTGKITVLCNLAFAGQLLAKEIVVGNEVKDDEFQFVPFKELPALVLSSKSATFEENDTWQTIKIGLDNESESDVTFNYCFKFNSQAVTGLYASKDDVAAADAFHDFPVCGEGTPATATIPKGKIYPSKDIYIKPLIDGLIENSTTGSEKLWLVISDVTGAKLSTDNYDNANGGFNIFIKDSEVPPTISNDLVINVNEDEKHVFTETEFNFQHATQSFASVIITGLPTAGTLVYNGTAVTKGQVIAVTDLSKLTYQAAENEFGSNYTTFKYKVIGDGTSSNTSIEFTAKVNVIPVNDKPSVAEANFSVNELDYSVSGGPIEVTDVSNERNKDSYTYTLVNVTGSDYTAFNSTFEIIKLSDQNATIKVKAGATLDYNKKKEYVVYAKATDNAATETSKIAGPLTSEQFKITVKITAVNEDPIIANQTFTVPEKNTDGTDWPSGKVIGNVIASDPDGDDLSFTVVTTDVPFKFNNGTKELVVTDGSKLDFETKTTWTFMVKVEDGQGGNATAQITVNIEDVQEIEIYVNDEGATVISGNTSAGTAIENITQNSDASTQAQLNEITSDITYTVSEGTSTNATEYFDIDKHGDITAKEDLVFEALYNGNEDNPGNEFTIVVTASGTNSKDEPVSTNITKKIIIADVNEEPVIKTEEPIAIPQTALSNGEIVGKIDAIDPDSCSFNPSFACRNGTHPQGFNKLTYTIDEILEVDGSTNFPFELDPNTGVITYRQGPSLIRQNRYNYTAVVSRVNEPNNTMQRRYEFIVKVTDSSTDPRNPPKFVKKKIVINITETAYISSSNSTSSSSEVSSSSTIISSSSSAETVTSSGSVKPASSSATVASSGSVKPASSSATVTSSGSVKPASSSATVASSGSVKPASSSATVASSGSVKPASSSATVASSGSVKPASSSATVASSGSVKPASSSATVASSGSVKPASSSATVASSGSVKPASSSATVASSGSVKPASSSATVASSGSVKPASSSAMVASSGSVKPASSSATVASSGSVKPASSSATVASSGSVKPASSSATVASSGSVKPASSSATVASSGSVKPTSSSATVASSGSVKPASSSATAASSESVKPASSSATVASSESNKPTSSSAKASSSESSKPKSSSSKTITSASSTSRNDVSSSSNKEVKSSSSKATSSSSRNSEYDAPTFYVRMTGAFEFEIVMDESLPSLAKQYAVMDMKGQVISIGELNDKGARVKVPTSGAYIVRIGLGYRRVNVK